MADIPEQTSQGLFWPSSIRGRLPLEAVWSPFETIALLKFGPKTIEELA